MKQIITKIIKFFEQRAANKQKEFQEAKDKERKFLYGMITNKATKYYDQWKVLVDSKHISAWTNEELTYLYKLLDMHLTLAVKEDLFWLVRCTYSSKAKYFKEPTPILQTNINNLYKYLSIGGVMSRQQCSVLLDDWGESSCPVYSQLGGLHISKLDGEIFQRCVDRAAKHIAQLKLEAVIKLDRGDNK